MKRIFEEAWLLFRQVVAALTLNRQWLLCLVEEERKRDQDVMQEAKK